MEKYVYLNELYDYYKELFTDKQKEYFEDYYFNNLSLAEIAEIHNVSRNAVHNQLKITEEKLEEYENKLKLLEKRNKIIDILENKIDNSIIEEIKEII
jgi:predicted DNA-binding protein YlxM (UPF0122 family)